MMESKRLSKLKWLIALTALTMAAQYALQGWMAAGKSPETLDDFFWIIDAAIWSARAVVEAFVLFYLFSTPGNSKLLTFFEVALIVLIIVTLGPVLAAVGLGLPMSAALSVGWYWGWSFAIASYAPLMIAAAGFAFKMQGDASEVVQPVRTVVQVEAEDVQPPDQNDITPEQVAQLYEQLGQNQSAVSRKLNIDRRRVATLLKAAQNGKDQN